MHQIVLYIHRLEGRHKQRQYKASLTTATIFFFFSFSVDTAFSIFAFLSGLPHDALVCSREARTGVPRSRGLRARDRSREVRGVQENAPAMDK